MSESKNAVSSTPTHIDPAALRTLGILNAEALKQYGAAARREFLIEGIIGERTVNLAVGNSGLGKTPLVVSMAVSIASGLPWLDRPVRQGRVLICDGESSYTEFYEIVHNLSRNTGIAVTDIPPANLYVWSPMWTPSEDADYGFGLPLLNQLVQAVQPDLVILDPIRLFFPKAEAKSEDTANMLNGLRSMTRKVRCAWLLVHHRRKIDAKYLIDLEQDPLQWFQQSCGALALVNHTDTRLGIDISTKGGADLVVSGFVRSRGRFGPIHLGRVYDDVVPMGYRQLGGVDFLPAAYKAAYAALDSEFRFSDVKKALGGNSDSNAAAFLNLTQSLGLVRKLGHGRYEKIMENAESGGKAIEIVR